MLIFCFSMVIIFLKNIFFKFDKKSLKLIITIMLLCIVLLKFYFIKQILFGFILEKIVWRKILLISLYWCSDIQSYIPWFKASLNSVTKFSCYYELTKDRVVQQNILYLIPWSRPQLWRQKAFWYNPTLAARKRRRDQVDSRLQRCPQRQPTVVLRGEPALFPSRVSDLPGRTRDGLDTLLVFSRLSGLQG